MYDTYRYNGLRPLEIEMIRAESRGQKLVVPRNGPVGRPDASHSLFRIRTGNEWLNGVRQAAPQMLFGPLWYQNELCIMFADTNVGKSVLAVQIGEAIARGQSVGPFAANVPATVLYVDFELSTTQFEARYTANDQRYVFSDRFYRAEVNYDSFDNTETSPHLVHKALEHGLRKTEASVLIIDNITSLRTGTDKANEALHLMKHLKALKTRYNVSLLVLAHTPKRNPSRPLTRNDLQGSKMLINFCDSAFALGESSSRPGMRYLKQIKQRYGTETYGAQNVCLGRIEQHDSLLQYRFDGFDTEYNHLHRRTAQERLELAERIRLLHAEGKSQRHIAGALGISLGSVNFTLNSEG